MKLLRGELDSARSLKDDPGSSFKEDAVLRGETLVEDFAERSLNPGMEALGGFFAAVSGGGLKESEFLDRRLRLASGKLLVLVPLSLRFSPLLDLLVAVSRVLRPLLGLAACFFALASTSRLLNPFASSDCQISIGRTAANIQD